MLPQHALPAPQQVLLPWYALKVRTRSEPVAVKALTERQFECFSPTIAERKKYCDRTTVIHTPVFPGYVFCRLDPNKKVPVISAPAVDYIVSFSGIPAIVPDDEVNNVRRALVAGARPHSYLAAGQRIRILAGSLAGLEGILERVGKEHRIVVSVHLLQRSVAVEIDEDLVQVVPNPIVNRKPTCHSLTRNAAW